MVPDPPAPTAPPAKSRSGCLLAVYIFLGVCAVGVVTTGIGAWFFLRSERGQKLIEVVRDGYSLMRQATQAPGTEALRAAGCTQAMVIPTTELLKLGGQLNPETRQDIPEKLRDESLVMCQIAGDVEGPDCPDVARIYAKAAPQAPERFGIIVQHQRGRQTRCQGSYARDGSRLGSLGGP